ncbi:MAG: chloride channel protein, partial [Muribaculaceae bacterium]|nr:chloride channel protein [Muribaculaceae bacterium]
MFPSLYGEGYDVIKDIINTDWVAPFDASVFNGGISIYLTLPMILGGVLILKCFACSASNSGGGVAGDFAPTLFAGCIAGLFFAVLMNNLLGIGLAPQVFAYIGMAGVMAGVIRAPLMALFLTAEMCNGFDYFLPLTVVTMISYGIVMLVTRRKFYEVHIHFAHHHNKSVSA